MRNIPLVSVITIFLDEEKFIREAIESVLDQTWTRWELLLVDDGSEDSSVEIARRYASEHSPRIRYLEHPGHANRGMSASRNLGLSQARGELIAFLDADDVWLPKKLEQQVAILESQPEAAMLYGRSLYWYSWTGNSENLGLDFEQGHWIKPEVLVPPPRLLGLFLEGKAALPTINSVLVRREAADHVRGFEERFSGLYEDQAFLAKVCLEHPVFVSENCWDLYRQHPDSTCASTESKQLEGEARESYLDWLATYLRQHHPEPAAIERAVRFERWLIRHAMVRRQIGRIRRLRRQWKSFVSRDLGRAGRRAGAGGGGMGES